MIIKRRGALIMGSCPHCGCYTTYKVHILSRRLPWWWYLECAKCHWCSKTKLFLWRAKRAWMKDSKKAWKLKQKGISKYEN